MVSRAEHIAKAEELLEHADIMVHIRSMNHDHIAAARDLAAIARVHLYAAQVVSESVSRETDRSQFGDHR